ncbi:MAG: putative selenium-dependent hydroxylase accessory protein YqeC [Treponema sp.]|jgi:probable selenium-dependent hydroxylase accessory protein YqeC|nr:putative selenium-dependent hydroxylase accessory protein YqeC [Treponema sp.]
MNQSESLSGRFEKLAFGAAEDAKGMPPVVAFTGSGGKTSLIELLAKKLTHKGRKILVSPTTKMRPFPPIPGVTMAGRLNRESGKLEALPPEELEKIIEDYDLVLLEGDGSKGLPLKGWAPYEPVIPRFTTLTVGILPLLPLGKPLSTEIVHRLPLFCELAGARPGELLRIRHLAALLSGGTGKRDLFSGASGDKALFFNQIEDETALARGHELAALLESGFRDSLCTIIAGSARLDTMSGCVP